MQLLQSQALAIFDYHEDGCLLWKYNSEWDGRVNGRLAGKIAGAPHDGHLRVGIDGVYFYVHKIIWLWHKGYWPERLDHWDGDGYNNRIENLRECTHAQNLQNKDVRCDSSIGIKGVSPHGNGYRARILVDGVRIHLGTRKTIEEAKALYNTAAREYFGEFAFENRP